MSYDEARSGFAIDADSTIATSNYLLIGDIAYGFTSAATNPTFNIYGDFDTYLLVVDIGYTYGIITTGNTPFGSPINNSNFVLADRTGGALALSTDSGAYSGLTFTATDSIYYISVYSDTVGFYGLYVGNNSVTETVGVGETITRGQSYVAALDYTSDVDKYYFFAEAGVSYTFAVGTTIPDLFIDIEYENLHVDNILANGLGMYSFTAPVTGLYKANVSSNVFTDTGIYGFVTDLRSESNNAPTGSVSISGTVRQGQVLTATNTLADLDGLGTVAYDWLSNGINISGATGSTYALSQSDVDKVITVIASYTDQLGSPELMVSSATASVVNVNDTATGSVSISGTARQGQVLTASNSLADVDGIGTVTYQWRSNGTNISGAIGSTYTLTQAEVGSAITVVASYTDLLGSAESVASGSTQAVAAVLSATYTVPVSSIDSIGLSPDGQYLLIKVDGVTQSVPIGSSLSFNGSTVTTSDLTSSITVQSVFQSSGGSSGYVLPEVFPPNRFNLDYQLIETADNAVVIGGATNDFIKVASTTSLGKAVDGGAGNDVIDGGVGSTFISGGTGSDTIFLDGRAPGVSWSTVTDFKLGEDKATIWGWKAGVSRVSTLFTDFNTGGAPGYTGLTLHFENLLPDDATPGQTNSNFNSITLTGLTLADFGATSLETLNAQITAGTNSNFITGQTTDEYGVHGYLFLS
jgi:hypothetical protein